MIANKNISVLISGAILLLAFLKITNPLKINKKGNFYFGLFLLVYSTFWLDEVVILDLGIYQKWLTIGKSILQFLVPVLFFMSVKFYTDPHYICKWKDVKYLIPLILFVLILTIEPVKALRDYNVLVTTFITISGLVFTALAYLEVSKHQKNIESFISNKEPVDLNWIKYIIYGFLGSILVYSLYALSTTSSSPNVYMNLYFLLIVYLTTYFSIRQGEIYPHELDINQLVSVGMGNTESSGKELMDEVDLENFKKRLLDCMETERPYLDSEVNLVKLAEQLSLSAHQLSYVVNKGFGENFFSFINKYKVEQAKKMLGSADYDHYTILAIAFESGFNSKTAFNTTFKKLTSHTPSEFRKIRTDL